MRKLMTAAAVTTLVGLLAAVLFVTKEETVQPVARPEARPEARPDGLEENAILMALAQSIIAGELQAVANSEPNVQEVEVHYYFPVKSHALYCFGHVDVAGLLIVASVTNVDCRIVVTSDPAFAEVEPGIRVLHLEYEAAG